MNVFEDLFPGNASVMSKLMAAFDTEGVTAFTGAGTSMPSLPGWSDLISTLVSDALTDGKIDKSTASALQADHGDYLYAVDEIYSFAGKAQTKSKVAKIYRALENPTHAHRLIVGTNFDRMMTLNYDVGLELASAADRAEHIRSIAARNHNERSEWLRHGSDSEIAPVLHWHGLAGDAESIVLSGSDYVEFYDNDPSNKETLREIFKTRRVLMIGFGFADPFIERELNSVMQPLPVANTHFAFIGIRDGSTADIKLERRRYAAKYKLETVFYPIGVTGASPDHSKLADLLQEISSACPRSTKTTEPGSAMQKVRNNLTLVSPSYRSSLFSFGEKQIYCEPNIWYSSIDDGSVKEFKMAFVDLMAAECHANIEAPHEYGLSTLGRRLLGDLTVAGKKAIFREAGSFPKYKRAILADPDFAAINPVDVFTVILDNFLVVEHQRTVRELIGAYENVRIIVLQRKSFAASADESLGELGFRGFRLDGLSRADIRTVVNIVAPTYNSDVTSSIVDKVYADLLQLCIPLTPSNVIMYASVLCKDGNFSPVSRLHIVDRFVTEALQRASDAYKATFNSIDKVGLLSEFCYGLFYKDKTSFTQNDWRIFCEQYLSDNLVEFSYSEILSDLINGRIVVQDGVTFHFRYRMFFSYFVGAHISTRPDLVTECLAENKHLQLDGLVEVLCGMLPDATDILSDLTEKLSASLARFYGDYPIKGFDLHEHIKWGMDSQDQGLWASVTEQLNQGPESTEELDVLKTSIHAERRTDDQKVSIIKFIASELNVTTNSSNLYEALESAKHATAKAKKAAAIAVINGHRLAYEVATVFVPMIAEKKYVTWNGFTYINLIEDDKLETPEGVSQKERMKALVAYALPSSMGRNAADVFGSRRLGPVFMALLDDPELSAPIEKHILFSLLIRCKPRGWLDRAKKIVAATARDDIYLRHMLNISIGQFHKEINTEGERNSLKELIAAVQLRRDINIKRPSSTDIKKTIGFLEKKGFWTTESE